MTKTEKYKILTKYIKDMSSETPDIETFLFVKKNIAKYQLDIGITSKPLKDKLVEISTTLKYEDKNQDNKKSYFEIVFCTVIKVSEEIKEKKDIEKIILCDVQKDIYPNIEASFLNLLHNSGYPEVKFEKKIDFEKLYNQRFN
jgi:preprotein translocase subunit SecB|tara:strand:- start:132 stop:560 length:429 start_codon:yes stop_codon:yes gene_type:complete